MNQNFADMTATQHLEEAEQQYRRIAHYAGNSAIKSNCRNEGIKEALQWATYHSEQAPIKQAAVFAANPALKAAYDRRQAASERLRKAHERATYQEFDAAQKEWSTAFDAYEQLRKQ